MGIHINLVALLLFISSGFLLQFTTAEVLVVFIISMAITHIFLDFIPSIFLGAPEESTALSVLPGHSMLLEGKGYEAVRLTTFGSYAGLIIMIIITPPFYFIPESNLSVPAKLYSIYSDSCFAVLDHKRKTKISCFDCLSTGRCPRDCNIESSGYQRAIVSFTNRVIWNINAFLKHN